MKFSTYYFQIKTKILADFQICIGVPLIISIVPIIISCNMHINSKTLFIIQFNYINPFLAKGEDVSRLRVCRKYLNKT